MRTVFRTPRKVPVGAILATLVTGCAIGRLWEPSREEVLQRILPSAVQVVVEQQEGRRVRTSSGVILASAPRDQPPTCFILTAGHTVSGIAGKKEVYVIFDRLRGKAKKAQATVVAFRDAPDLDLALLKTEVNHCVPVRTASPPNLGASVWVVGYPWGRHRTLASGIVSQVNADDSTGPEADSRLMVDASVSYGSSGGGVYEARGGALIGIVQGYSTARVSAQGANPPWYIDVPVPGQTYLTPLSDVMRFLSEAGYASLIGPANGQPDSRAAADSTR